MVRTSSARVRVRAVRTQHDPSNLSLNLRQRKDTSSIGRVTGGNLILNFWWHVPHTIACGRQGTMDSLLPACNARCDCQLVTVVIVFFCFFLCFF